jgi:hypothetical protein
LPNIAHRLGQTKRWLDFRTIQVRSRTCQAKQRRTTAERDFIADAAGTPHSARSQPRGIVMRAHRVIAVIAAILVGVGVKLIFFTAPAAEADTLSIRTVGVDVSQFHRNVESLPVQTFHDMSLVFADGD